MQLPSRVCALLALLTLAAAPADGRAQSSRAIRRLEAGVWTRIAARARASHGLTLHSGQFDLRLPIHGEPDEVTGATARARDALAIASARLEPGDAGVDSREQRFEKGRYDLRIEDRAGNCLAIHQEVRSMGDSTIERGARMVEPCRPLYMAEVVRRGRRLAHLPLNAGQLTDHWSVASAIDGWADVYADSVVIIASTLALRAGYPQPDTLAQHVDSVTVGLALGGDSWSIVRRSAAVVVDTTLHPRGEWSRRRLRFTIPRDSAFALGESWPVVEVVLGVRKTADNPSGMAWTYAHAAKPFFQRTNPPRKSAAGLSEP
jgi:hypothetical protein